MFYFVEATRAGWDVANENSSLVLYLAIGSKSYRILAKRVKGKWMSVATVK
jgi:hypothetical protein